MTKQDYLIRLRFTKQLDSDRITEWLEASFTDEFVEVVDRETGDVIESWGTDPVPFICPECNEPAYSILESAGTKKYWHVGDESCVVEQ